MNAEEFIEKYCSYCAGIWECSENGELIKEQVDICMDKNKDKIEDDDLGLEN